MMGFMLNVISENLLTATNESGVFVLKGNDCDGFEVGRWGSVRTAMFDTKTRVLEHLADPQWVNANL